MASPHKNPNAIRRNKEPEKTLLKSDTKMRGFALPDGVLTDKHGEPEDWHPMTKKWWTAWRKSPQAAGMLSEVDWYFMVDTALIHHNMWSNGRWEFANEVRMRVAKFGATPEDRNRLRMEIDVPETSPVGIKNKGNEVTSLDSRRSRIS